LEGGEDPNETAINIYVDGSYVNGQYSWGIAVYENGKLIFTDKGIGEDVEAANLRNVAGEMAGAVKAIEWAEANSQMPITIHHDYSGLAHWAEGSWKAKNRFTQAYAVFTSQRLSWVRFNKVAGHSGIEGNEVADKLAGEAIKGK
jgi:ribonuclease HI